MSPPAPAASLERPDPEPGPPGERGYEADKKDAVAVVGDVDDNGDVGDSEEDDGDIKVDEEEDNDDDDDEEEELEEEDDDRGFRLSVPVVELGLATPLRPAVAAPTASESPSIAAPSTLLCSEDDDVAVDVDKEDDDDDVEVENGAALRLRGPCLADADEDDTAEEVPPGSSWPGEDGGGAPVAFRASFSCSNALEAEDREEDEPSSLSLLHAASTSYHPCVCYASAVNRDEEKNDEIYTSMAT